jgi:hypothetical protein
MNHITWFPNHSFYDYFLLVPTIPRNLHKKVVKTVVKPDLFILQMLQPLIPNKDNSREWS